MKIKSLMFLAGLFAAGLTSCSNDDEAGKEYTESGDPTSFNLIIQQPKTYADDENATAEEIKVNTVDVIIFDENSVFVDRYHVDNPTPDTNDPTKYVINGIPTTTGQKEIYVGLNLPQSLMTGYSKGVLKANSLDKAHEVTVADLTSNGIAMFSQEGVTSVLVKAGDTDYSNKNVIRTNVERMVAKVTVQKANGLVLDSDANVEKGVVGGKILPDMTFGIRNINKLMYPVQRKNEGTNLVIDPNWEDQSYRAEDFYHEGHLAPNDQYITVDEHDTNIKLLNVKYATENTSEKHYRQETTYASLRVTFLPDEFTDANGNQTPNTNSTGVNFWTLTLQDGSLLYFDSRTTLQDYVDNNNLPDGTYIVSDTYRNGHCYYNMFLNPNGEDGNEYGTLRNEHYKASITRIYGLGNPNPNEGGEEEIPVESTTHIDVVVTPIPWTVISDDYELRK
ncbi:MAG: Mfa1 family fimbria major subunit [Candidatus Azobacteroides sp.]|nr:Mfa1 family fimbria major subunit [Candidatus Azobacteroides sp.]